MGYDTKAGAAFMTGTVTLAIWWFAVLANFVLWARA